MSTKAVPFVTLALAAFVSSCAGTHTAAYEVVRIKTYSLDGTCQLGGTGDVIQAKAPAVLVVPFSAAPVTVVCSTKANT